MTLSLGIFYLVQEDPRCTPVPPVVNDFCRELIKYLTRSPHPDYNTPVATPAPQKPAPPAHSEHHHSMYAAEATGLLFMAILLLILIVIRYWPNIQWSAH